MQALPDDRIALRIDEARALAHEALTALDFDDDEAAIVADHVVDAALCGYEYSGLPKNLNLADLNRAGITFSHQWTAAATVCR